MSTETAEQPVKKKEREGLFSAKRRKLLTDPLDDDNPVTVQVLGICSALAITVQLKPSLFMFGAVIFVMCMANVIISLIRNLVPSRVRIIAQLVIIAALVIVVDQMLKAFAYDMSKQLSVFVGLIITNCIVMGRLEAFAMGNKPWPSFLDGLGNAAAYGMILIIVSLVREVFGSGTITVPTSFNSDYKLKVFPEAFYEMGYQNNGLMILPAMALIVVGIIIWVQRSRNKKLYEAN